MKRNGAESTSWRTGLVGGLLALSPALAVAQQAQTPFASAVLYEVREDINCNPGTSTAPDCGDTTANGFGTRIADATLEGATTGAPAFTGLMRTDASSILSKVDWTGPAHGKISVQSAVGSTFAVFSGQLNLSLALLSNPPMPLAPISGTWTGTKGTLHGGGDFSGAFLVPFQLPDLPDLGWFYLELDPATGRPNGRVVSLRPGEFNPNDPLNGGEFQNGIPLVKLTAGFYKK